jgi:uncharacterized membrane protein YfcA
MFDLVTANQVILIAIITFLAGIVQGTAGMGFAVVSVPLLRIVAPDLVPVPLMTAMMAISLASLIRERQHVSLPRVGWVLAGRVPGAILGAFLLATIPSFALDVSIGAMVLLAAVAMAVGWVIPYNRVSQFLAGLVSGTTGTSTGIGGPPLAMLYRERKGPELRSTLGTVFVVGLTINLTTLALSGQLTFHDVQLGALVVPPSLLGFAASSRLRNVIEGEPLRKAVLILSSAAAITLLARTLL